MQRIFILIILLFLSSGCSIYGNQRGVINKWRDQSLPQFQKGVDTQTDVVQTLGPPSQIIGVNDEVVFYYLSERASGKSVILILFNWHSEKVLYDRAIFFFDQKGMLKEYAYSLEKLPFKN